MSVTRVYRERYGIRIQLEEGNKENVMISEIINISMNHRPSPAEVGNRIFTEPKSFHTHNQGHLKQWWIRLSTQKRDHLREKKNIFLYI